MLKLLFQCTGMFGRFGYKFYPFSWMPGGHFTYPDDMKKLQYYHQRGFKDRYTHPIELPYKAFL